MSKRRNHEEHEEENSERWLLTYSDLITLLLALFIILYSIAQVDAKKFNAVAEQFRGQMGNQSSQSQSSSGKGQYALPPGDILSEEIDIEGAGDGTALSQVYNQIQGYIEQNGLESQITLYNTEDYVRIHIKDKLMFVPDSSKLVDPDNPALKNIEKAIEQVYNDVGNITFSGHTADVGNNTLVSDQTSWRLSTERAITVLNNFIAYGLPQEKLSIQGFAHFEPVADNSTEDGRAQNRRVEITIYKNDDAVASQFDEKPDAPDATSSTNSTASTN